MIGADPPLKSLAGRAGQRLRTAVLPRALRKLLCANTVNETPNGHGAFFKSINSHSLPVPVADRCDAGSSRLRRKARADLVSFLRFQRLAHQSTSIRFRGTSRDDLQVLTPGANPKQCTVAQSCEFTQHCSQALGRPITRRGGELPSYGNHRLEGIVLEQLAGTPRQIEARRSSVSARSTSG